MDMQHEIINNSKLPEDLATTRKIVPQLTQDLKEQNVADDIFWHNEEAKQLERKLGSATGLFIRKEMCMFIPAPSFHEMYVFKEIKIGKQPITEQTLNTIGATAVLHFSKIDQQLRNMRNRSGKPEKVHVVFVIYKLETGKKANTDKDVPGNSKGPDVTEEWTQSFDRQFRENNWDNIIPSCKIVKESEVNEKLVENRTQENNFTQSQELKLLAAKICESELFGMETSNEVFRLSGGGNISFSDEDKVEKCFIETFPPDRLHIVPDIDSLFDNLLYQTDETGRLVDTDKHFSYSGEVKFFYQHFASKLNRDLPGIFLKDFQPLHVNKLFKWSYIKNYQIDWMFLGAQTIVVFEVGMVRDPLNPKDALNSKIQQVRKNLMPLMKILLKGITMSYQTNKRITKTEDIWAFFKKKISFVIYLPNANANAVREYLCNRSKGHVSTKESTPDPEFLVICQTEPHASEDTGCHMETFAITSKDQVVFKNKLISIDNILTTSVWELHRSDLSECTENNCFVEQLSTITQLLALSFLTVVSLPWRPLEVEERYLEGYKKMLKSIKYEEESDCTKRNSEDTICKLLLPKVNGRSLILSREQLQLLLNGTNKFLIVNGEAGTGKTILFLMKASLLARESDIQKVYYIIPETKTALDSFLQNFLSENKSILRDKLEVLKISSNCISTLYDKMSSAADRVALFVDEFYYHSAQIFSLFPAAFCWISYVTHGKRRLGETGRGKETIGSNFKQVQLHVLLRSAEHISSAGHKLIHYSKNVDETTATVPGAFMSSQRSVEVFSEYFSDHNCDLLELFEKYYSKASSKFNESRFVIVITAEKRKKLWDEIEKNYSQQSKFFVEVYNEKFDLNHVPFTGAECMSVIVFVDVKDAKKLRRKKSKQAYSGLQQVVYAALTRACYEAIVVINKSRYELQRFLETINAPLTFSHCLLKGEGFPLLSSFLSYDDIWLAGKNDQKFKLNEMNESIKNSCTEVKCHLLLAIARNHLKTNVFKRHSKTQLSNDPLFCLLAQLSKTTHNMRNEVEAEEVLWKLWKELLDDLNDEYVNVAFFEAIFYTVNGESRSKIVYLENSLLRPCIPTLKSDDQFKFIFEGIRLFYEFIISPAIVYEIVERWMKLNRPVVQLDISFDTLLYRICITEEPRDDNFRQDIIRLFQLLAENQYPIKRLVDGGELVGSVFYSSNYVLAKYLLDFDDRIDTDIRERHKINLSLPYSVDVNLRAELSIIATLDEIESAARSSPDELNQGLDGHRQLTDRWAGVQKFLQARAAQTAVGDSESL